MTSATPEYRPSASLIMAVRRAQPEEASDCHYDYDVLLFKRTVATAYMPDHCVFPGGTFEAGADEASDWLAYLRECGITDAQLGALTPPCDERPAPLLTAGANFARDISLRITALRETFEEVGVLLCRTLDGRSVCHERFERAAWQRRVHRDAAQYLQLCRQLRVLPDLWLLQEWSCWRSPATASRKFDTVYYLAALERRPALLLEPHEVAVALWDTPTRFLRDFAARDLWLPPTQFYELSRLTHARHWRDLDKFARQRSNTGCTLLWLVYYRTHGGVLVGTLPGDDAYPARPADYALTVDVAATCEAFGRQARRRHRLIISDAYSMSVDANIPPVDAHLSPVMALAAPHCKM